MLSHSTCQSINQNSDSARFKMPTPRRSWPRPSGKEQSWEGGGIENRHHLESALDLLEIHSPWTIHRKRTNLHCRNAGKLDHYITVHRFTSKSCVLKCQLSNSPNNPLRRQTHDATNYEENKQTVQCLAWLVLTRRDVSLCHVIFLHNCYFPKRAIMQCGEGAKFETALYVNFENCHTAGILQSRLLQ